MASPTYSSVDSSPAHGGSSPGSSSPASSPAQGAYSPVSSSPAEENAASRRDLQAVEAKPPASRTTCRQWARLGVVWCCCTLAAGLIPGQAVFAAMFADAGVFSATCEASHGLPCDKQVAELNLMFGFGLMMTALSQIPNGLIFDLYGGQMCGTAGAATVCIGLFLESIAVLSAINGTDSSTNWLVPVAAIITDFGSMLNSFCFFGLIWHYPGSTTMILSLSTATYQVSALLPLALQFVMDNTGINFGYAMLGYTASILITVPIIWHATPTQQDYYDRAREILGVPIPKPKVSFDVGKKLTAGWNAVRMDLKDHVFLCAGFAFSQTLAGLYNAMSSAYGRHLFGSKEAGDQLAQMQVEATALVGAICAPSLAKFADCIGLQRFAWMLTIFVAVPLALFAVPDWRAAGVTTLGFCLFTTLNQLFMSRYFLHYAPPNRLGIYAGVFGMLMMAIVMPAFMLSYAWIMAMPEDNPYFVPFLASGVLGIISMIGFNIHFCIAHDGHGVPRLPNMLPEDEMELCIPFGAMNLNEASEIMGLEKDELFKRLADPDPESMKALMGLVNTDKVTEALAKHDADDFIKMLEASPDMDAEESEDEGKDKDQASQVPHAVSDPLLNQNKVEPSDAPAGREEAAGAALESGESNAAVDAPEKKLAQDLRQLFHTTGSSDARTAALSGAAREQNEELRCRALGECLDMLVREGDAAGCKLFLLEVPTDDQWKCFIGMEDWMDEKRQKEMEKKFNKLIPPKQFAALMRQNRGLKDVMARLMKREVERSVNRFRGKKGNKSGP